MIYKQEALDSIEVFRRNTIHVLGENDPQVKTIDTCKMLVEEVEDYPEIILCKDCRYQGTYSYCNYWGKFLKDDDFCSAGDRRE